VKICNECNTEKALEDFPKEKTAKGGRGTKCKQCRNFRTNQLRLERCNRTDICIPASKLCPRCDTEKSSDEFSKDSGRVDGLNGFCKACMKVSKKNWRNENREYWLEHSKEYTNRRRKENPEKVAKEWRKWARENRGYLNELGRRRDAKKRNASVSWANVDVMKVIYDLAIKKTKVTGTPHQVDHIVPLVSDKVCGLHVEWNLQVLTQAENCSKNNRWWPDMWES
jgi:hypothetical protein